MLSVAREVLKSSVVGSTDSAALLYVLSFSNIFQSLPTKDSCIKHHLTSVLQDLFCLLFSSS